MKIEIIHAGLAEGAVNVARDIEIVIALCLGSALTKKVSSVQNRTRSIS